MALATQAATWRKQTRAFAMLRRAWCVAFLQQRDSLLTLAAMTP